ncbi:putative quinol monooxygenase [Leekyejoonella antrihumi]|uniref:Antibiotic biosynthesis monooxygenase n=1 Tax=Leekyejoonella antrihumi TaxID=1660198 RepID=A0A563DT71_9MICO|nr:putative quinol monooxygenase [Leekyejoonella antrihumi]TWP33435.1 antibiotic biosynthesis monooxygenase [Leekyejoonella antrihumi]
MSELRVVAEITAKPGSEQVVRDALATLAAASRGDDGCNSYELFESAAAAGTFFTIESWESQAKLDAHMQAPHLAQALKVAGEHLTAAPAIHPLQSVGT